MFVLDLRRINVMSADDALRAVALGRKNRHVVATLFNEHSSRRYVSVWMSDQILVGHFWT